MAAGTVRREAPASREEAAALLGSAAADGARVRPVGGGTKLGWGKPAPEPDLELSTRRLARVVEHNEGDLTAVIEAGTPLAEARAALAGAGQMLALDPPLGDGEAATVGGIVATRDSGPLRGARYGSARDVVVGVTVALSDGTVARAGGKVIKNVAGYDLAKLFTGSFGTLGLVLEVSVRLHPRPERTLTAVGRGGDPEAIARGASALSHAPVEHEGLDVRWEAGHGEVLIRFGGAAPKAQAESAIRHLRDAALAPELIEEDDAELWERQRAGQRSTEGTVVRVSGLQTELASVLAVAERLGGRVVGRAAPGLSWIRLEERSPQEALGGVEELRRELRPSPCVVLDAPIEVRQALDPWGQVDAGALELMRRVKKRFDPAGACNTGTFVGGI
jgi:glycolate dehydrogenase FAD-binding subunit